jgi:hypothetical protein
LAYLRRRKAVALLHLELAIGRLARRLVRGEQCSLGQGLAVDQLQGGRCGTRLEQPLAGAEHDRFDEHPVLVDQVLSVQCLRQSRAAVDLDLPDVSVLEPGYLGGDVAADDRGRLPVGVLQRRRYDVLGQAVEPGCHRIVQLVDGEWYQADTIRPWL